MASTAAITSLALLLGLLVYAPISEGAQPGVLVSWDFDAGTQGWGNNSALAQGAEVTAAGGILTAAATSAGAFLDSPGFAVPATDATHAVLHLAYAGPPLQAEVLFRLGAAPPPPAVARGHGDWTGAVSRTVALHGDGAFHTYAVPLVVPQAGASAPVPQPDSITQLRLRPAGAAAAAGAVFRLQYVRLAEAPRITRVGGCKPVLHDANTAPQPAAPFQVAARANGSVADVHFADASATGNGSADASLPYTATYDCHVLGGDRVTVAGSGFGGAGARVLVGARACTHVRHAANGTSLTCRVPPGTGTRLPVTVTHGGMPALSGAAPLLSYAVGPPPPPVLVASNLGARHMDLNWAPPPTPRAANTVTGYTLQWRAAKTLAQVLQGGALPTDYVFDADAAGRLLPLHPTRPWEVSQAYLACCARGWTAWGEGGRSMTLSNVTVTTVVDLEPGTRYQFRAAALSESTLDGAWAGADLYGRRDALPGAMQGAWSPPSAIERTLEADFAFPFFNANATLNHGPADARASLGQLDAMAGEGHYGLLLVGSASVAGCNASHSCCDGFGGTPATVAALAPAPGHWDAQGEEAFMYPDAVPAVVAAAVAAAAAIAPAPGLAPPFDGVSTAALQAAARHNALAALAALDGWGGAPPAPRPAGADWNYAHLAGRGPPPAATCTLQCSATARLRPAYMNGVPLRSSQHQRATPALGAPPAVPLDAAAYAAAVAPFPGATLRDAAVAVLSARAELPTPSSASVYGVRAGAAAYPSGIAVGEPSAFGAPGTAPCGPALRLTPAAPRQVGAAWYPRAQQVREGFDTSFTFRLASPSTHCKRMDDAYTNCRARGGEGLAFVVQNQHPAALGKAGAGLGYDGIANSLAVEFDTYASAGQLDPGENHISVHSRGWAAPNSANHTHSLGQAVARLPDMTDGVVRVRITYDPVFDTDAATFIADNLMNVAQFITNGPAYTDGGAPQWVTGLGVLRVYLFDAATPVLTVPCNLDATLQLDNGRGWVGFTASTGDAVWQATELLSWSFTQSRRYITPIAGAYPAFSVNGAGGYEPASFTP